MRKRFVSGAKVRRARVWSPGPLAGVLALPCLAVATALMAATPAPTPTWIALQDGNTHFFDYANAVTTDASGNVYVTGSADGDYLTIKYGPDGNLLWSARYDGSAHGQDTPVAIAVNGSGEVYVTGSSFGGDPSRGGTDYDLATIKYNAAGVEQWVRRYNGSGNQDDAGTDLVLDSEGNAIVTGYVFEAVSAWDIITLKYEADGLLRWTASYDHSFGPDRAAAVTVDAQDNIYVTGESGALASGMDYITLSYLPSGSRRWVARYNGPSNGTDSATAITVSADGEACVTGYSAGSANTDVATVQYAADGSQLWANRYNGSANGPDGGQAITSDPAGNVYVTGTVYRAQTGYDYLTLKYSPSGVQQWEGIFNGNGGSEDHARAIAVDAGGNVYVTGMAGSTTGTTGFATLKYTGGGSAVWTARYDGQRVGPGGATDLTLGVDGGLVVTGTAWTNAGGQDFATLRYPPAPPVAPTALAAVATETQVALSWTHSGYGATTFTVQRKSGNGNFADLATVPAGATTYTDLTVVAGGQYVYQVRANGPGGSSEPSNSRSVIIPGGIPGKLTVNAKKLNFGAVTIGKSKLKKIKLKNGGKGAIFGELSLSGSAFTLVGGGTSLNLAPKQSATVTVQFAPTAAGQASGSLEIRSNDPARPAINVALTAKGK